MSKWLIALTGSQTYEAVKQVNKVHVP